MNASTPRYLVTYEEAPTMPNGYCDQQSGVLTSQWEARDLAAMLRGKPQVSNVQVWTAIELLPEPGE